MKAKNSVQGSHEIDHATMNLRPAVGEALLLLGPEMQETVLQVLSVRYNIDLENSQNTDKVYAAIDDLFGTAGRIFKRKIEVNLKLAFPNPQAA
jgi:hypothetical protein